MSRQDNLRSFANLPKEEHLAISRKGGINSGRKRRYRKLMAHVVDTWTQDTIRSLERDWRAFERDNERLNENIGLLTLMTEPEQMELFEALGDGLEDLLQEYEGLESELEAEIDTRAQKIL